ncbi:hypothetical protein E2C01_006650 [Portunus trituberculatus]|uniref:Uncharacterized protein n=1 Tax=Portunus trituberculatus TaxID=210409 RepID=A0A5B7CYE5_PORTR|nr:hypothetical protein [Portunus trituberculatus]
MLHPSAAKSFRSNCPSPPPSFSSSSSSPRLIDSDTSTKSTVGMFKSFLMFCRFERHAGHPARTNSATQLCTDFTLRMYNLHLSPKIFSKAIHKTKIASFKMPAHGEDRQPRETDSLLASEEDSSDSSDDNYLKRVLFIKELQQEDWTHFPGKRISYGTCKQRVGITLTWRDLSVYVPEKKTCFTRRHNQYQPVKKVLSNVFGAVQSGSLLAMMGAR